jgi:hypothetical protein
MLKQANVEYEGCRANNTQRKVKQNKKRTRADEVTGLADRPPSEWPNVHGQDPLLTSFGAGDGGRERIERVGVACMLTWWLETLDSS